MTTDTPVKVIVDCSTGEQSIVPLTEEEISNLETAKAAAEAEQAAEEAAEQARLAAKGAAEQKLMSLGLTAEEIAALSK